MIDEIGTAKVMAIGTCCHLTSLWILPTTSTQKKLKHGISQRVQSLKGLSELPFGESFDTLVRLV
jgi:hypothetical protein